MLRTEGNDYRNAATSPHVSPVVSRHRGPARPGDLAHRHAHPLRHAHRPGRSLGGARGGGLLLVVLGHGGPCLTVFLADHPRTYHSASLRRGTATSNPATSGATSPVFARHRWFDGGYRCAYREPTQTFSCSLLCAGAPHGGLPVVNLKWGLL